MGVSDPVVVTGVLGGADLGLLGTTLRATSGMFCIDRHQPHTHPLRCPVLHFANDCNPVNSILLTYLFYPERNIYFNFLFITESISLRLVVDRDEYVTELCMDTV